MGKSCRLSVLSGKNFYRVGRRVQVAGGRGWCDDRRRADGRRKSAREIEAQGFCDLDAQTYAQINYPLRLSPAICLVWTAVGTALESPVILWALVPFAALGALLPGHPFDVVYNHGLRYLFRTPALPPYGRRRRFACALATMMLITAAGGFQAGSPALGHLAGWSLVFTAFVNVSTGFCIPSFIVRMVFGKVACADQRLRRPA